jgi:hypothetical protein
MVFKSDTLENRLEIRVSFQIWCRRRMRKIIRTDHEKNEEVGNFKE